MFYMIIMSNKKPHSRLRQLTDDGHSSDNAKGSPPATPCGISIFESWKIED
jgi:hypothetical protein